jgi:hypothetical protein
MPVACTRRIDLYPETCLCSQVIKNSVRQWRTADIAEANHKYFHNANIPPGLAAARKDTGMIKKKACLPGGPDVTGASDDIQSVV